MTTITFTGTDLSTVVRKVNLGVQGAHCYISAGKTGKLLNDFLDGVNKGSIIGNVVTHDSYSVFSGLSAGKAYIETGMTDSKAITFFQVVKLPNVDGPHALTLTNFASGDIGCSFQVKTAKGIQVTHFMQARMNDENTGQIAASATVNHTNIDNWHFFIGEGSNTAPTRIYNVTEGLTQVSSNTNPRVVSPNHKIKIGATHITSGGYQGDSHVAISGVINRILTDAERKTFIERVIKLASLFGITLVNGFQT